MIDPYVNPEPEPSRQDGPTDFFSLLSAPPEPSSLPSSTQKQRTDFVSLSGGTPLQPKVILNSSLADQFINFTTPCLIFILSNVTLMYLLNIRFIYTSVIDLSLRVFSVFFVLGVVALNRVIARKGSQESYVYVLGLFVAVALYTIATTRGYEMGSITRNFLNNSIWVALLFNMSVVIGIWWMVNRLTHECCVDENAVAGDIGIFTATAEKMRWAFQRAAADPREAVRKPLKAADVQDPWHQINAFDPTEAREAPPSLPPPAKRDYSDRLPARHPGMALFYFSIPVMVIFTLGLRVIQHAGMPAVRMGAYYMVVYTFCVLFLLSLTCLRQLRAYFALRGVSMNADLSWLWIGSSLFMILMIMWMASILPMPAMPPVAYVDEQQIEAYVPETARLVLLDVTPPTLSYMERHRVRERLDLLARMVMAVLLLYGLVKGLAYVMGMVLLRKDKLPFVLAAIITLLTWFLFRVWPALFRWTFRRRLHIQRHVALSTRYDNPLGRPGVRMSTREHVSYAYDALRALATDVGAPPKSSQTPYEFLKNYPQALKSMRDEAEEIIRLYVVAAYSDDEMNLRIEDRLRKFWMAFRITRNYYVW